MSLASQAASLEAAFSKASANREGYRPPAPLPQDNGMFKQPVKAPNTEPKNPNRLGIKTPPPVTRTPPVPAPRPAPPPSGNGAGFGSGLARVANGIGLAAAVGDALANPSAGNIAKAIGAGLMTSKNPYAYGAGLLAYGAGSFANGFNRSPDSIKDTGGNKEESIIKGDPQVAGLRYAIEFSVFDPNGDQNTYYICGLGSSAAVYTSPQVTTTKFGYTYVAPINSYGWRKESNGLTINGEEIGLYLNTGKNLSLRIVRLPNQVGTAPPDAGTQFLPAANFDGFEAPDYQGIKESQINLPSLASNSLLGTGTTPNPRASNFPFPQQFQLSWLLPANSPQTLGNSLPQGRSTNYFLVNSLNNTNSSNNTNPTTSKNYIKKETPSPKKSPTPNPIPKPEPKKQPDIKSQTQPQRFDKPSDCKFSCSALADCFTNVEVDIFDGCDPKSGKPKTRKITIQTLPKDRNKTIASFKELLDIRSRECALNEKVLTVPEYWQTRVGQRPQAVVLYREFVNGKFGAAYYSLHIPHYNGNKNTKPRLTQYNKGEHSAIYVCKDNSKLTVFAASEQEAKRMINELEKHINPRLRGDTVKLGIRKGLNTTTVRPIRLDFFSTGQTKLSPDWSIAL